MNIEKEYIIAFIGVGGTILGTILGFLSTIWYKSLKEKGRVKAELHSAINKVLFVGLTNNYPVALNSLRKVVDANAHIIKNRELANFYREWLTNPIIEDGQPSLNVFTDEQLEKLLSDLSNIHI